MRLVPALLVFAATALGAGAATPEEELLAARESAQAARALAQWRARHPDHPLEPYAHFWTLQGTLGRADPNEVRGFLARHKALPIAETLRLEWLKTLAATGDWATFRAEHKSLLADDGEIPCLALRDRYERGDTEAAAEARSLFTTAGELPAPCDAVFDALVTAKKLSDEEVWSRIRRLLAANQVREAKRLNALLPKAQAFNDKALDRAAADPSRFLAREKPALVSRAQREIALFAIGRLARTKPEDAASHLVALGPRLGSQASESAWANIALQAAMSHHPRALDYYGMAKDAALNDTQVAWKARAALRAGDWKAVLAAIQQLTAEGARDPAWRYWRARALKQQGDAAAAAPLLAELARENHFYGLLAAEETGTLVAPDWKGAQLEPAELQRAREIPGIRRALLLYGLGLDTEALREWIWALRGRGDRELLAAAEVARLANEPDRAINTADRTVAVHDFAQRYPIPHREATASSARQWSLDEAMVYSIIRQESRLVPEARSRVGATGLMQLMPATASWVAKQIPLNSYRPEMLKQPEVNIQMGTYYFRRVLDELGHPILATAAYNAGPGRARRWRDERPLEGAIYVESIPFNETRDYVKKVFANAWYYRHRLTGQPASLRQLLGLVPGRAADAPGTSVASNIP